MLEQTLTAVTLQGKTKNEDYWSRPQNIEGTPEFLETLEKSIEETKLNGGISSNVVFSKLRLMIAEKQGNRKP